jgi:hypothetical protein
MTNKKYTEHFLMSELKDVQNRMKLSSEKDVQNVAEQHYLFGLSMGIVYLLEKNGYEKPKK